MDPASLARALGDVTVALMNGHGAGAGVVWAPDWVVTNAHVAPHAEVTVPRLGRERLEGRVIARDQEADLALIHVPGLGLPRATLGAREPPPVGSLIVAVGHPFGVRGALTTGIVHAIGPLVPRGRWWIQADLRLAPGNSGGPLADARGRVLGINAMIVGTLALAIPVSEVMAFVRAAGVSIE